MTVLRGTRNVACLVSCSLCWQGDRHRNDAAADDDRRDRWSTGRGWIWEQLRSRHDPPSAETSATSLAWHATRTSATPPRSVEHRPHGSRLCGHGERRNDL